MTTGNMLQSEAGTDVNCMGSLSGYWRRILAWLVDFILLGLVWIICFRLTLSVSNFSVWGNLVILLLPAYFAFLNSRFSHGQTVGKMLTGIRVVGQDGRYISFWRSLLRIIILLIPYWTAGLWMSHFLPIVSLPGMRLPGLALSYLGSGMFVAIIYLYIVNRRTGQSVHDLLMGTFVVRAMVTSPPNTEPISRRHWIILAVCVAVPIAWISAHRITSDADYRNVAALEQELADLEGFGRITSVQITEDTLTFDVEWANRPDSFDQAINQVAKTVFQNYPQAHNVDQILIGVFWDYDLWFGIRSTGDVWSGTPAQWKKRLDERI